MARRVLLLAAAALAAGFGGVYVSVMQDQGDRPAGWFVLLIALAAGASVAAAVAADRRALAVTATVALTAAMLVSALSIGILLLPAVILSAVAAALPARTA